MPKPRLPANKKLAFQGIRISPVAKRRLEQLPTPEKKRVIAAMRQAVEFIINSMTHNGLPDNRGNHCAD